MKCCELKDFEEVKELIRVVEYVFGCDIMSKKRKRHIVNARMVVSYILRLKGNTFSSIAEVINRDHSTIIHYVNNIESYLKSDDAFKTQYEEVKELYDFNAESPFKSKSSEMSKVIDDLQNKNKSLNLQILLLKEKNEHLQYTLNTKVHKIIKERVKKGTEDEIMVKLNRFFNGVYS